MSDNKLPIPIAPLLEAPPAPHSREIWEAVESRRARRKQRVARRARNGLLASLAVAAGYLLFNLGAERSAGPAVSPLALRDHDSLPGTLVAPRSGYRAFDFSDGSRVTVAAGAQVDVLIASNKHVELVLREGRARFDIKPRGPRSWRIQSSGVSVDVVGTSFVVERTPGHVDVAVDHGIVVVRGTGLPDGVRKLTGGERAHVPLSTAQPTSGVAADRAVLPAAAPISALALPSPTPPAGVSASRAARAAEVSRPAEPKSVAQDPTAAAEALWRAVDDARRHRAHAKALQILHSLMRRDPRSEQRALAAFTAGQVSLDNLARPDEAARDFEVALGLGLPSPLDIEAKRLRDLARARLKRP
jgi:transmembrane sensor